MLLFTFVPFTKPLSAVIFLEGFNILQRAKVMMRWVMMMMTEDDDWFNQTILVFPYNDESKQAGER